MRPDSFIFCVGREKTLIRSRSVHKVACCRYVRVPLQSIRIAGQKAVSMLKQEKWSHHSNSVSIYLSFFLSFFLSTMMTTLLNVDSHQTMFIHPIQRRQSRQVGRSMVDKEKPTKAFDDNERQEDDDETKYSLNQQRRFSIPSRYFSMDKKTLPTTTRATYMQKKQFSVALSTNKILIAMKRGKQNIGRGLATDRFDFKRPSVIYYLV